MRIARTGSRTALLAAGIALALGLAPAAGAAPRAKLSVGKLGSPPNSLAAGGSFELTGTVRNKGDRGTTAVVEVSLNGGRRIGSKRLGKVRGDGSRRFVVGSSVPADLAAGNYRVQVCVKRRGSKGKPRCRSRRGLAVTAATATTPPTPPVQFTPGARTTVDPLFPQVGNGGYDARHYSIDLDYDPAANVFNAASTRVDAVATQNLSELSLDFQDLSVARVTVNGAPAQFAQVDSEPDLSPNPAVTQPMKLVVTPAAGIPSEAAFTVEVEYAGTPVMITDPDLALDGWIQACYGPSRTPPCDGAFVVNEPIGTQGWFPSNNIPTDKATFDTSITVPTTHTAFGVGELGSRVDNGDGTWTWSWSEDDPTATYLTTATVGLFDYSLEAMIETPTNRALAMYFGIDSSFTTPQKDGVAAIFDQTPAMLDFLSERYGPYPFDSIGGVQDRTVGVGYALEVQTKPHYASLGSISATTQLHEIAHQWFGNSATLAEWTDIWFNEGWAEWSEWIWGFEENGGDSPSQHFDQLYATTPDAAWEVAPAVLDGDPALLFSNFPVYQRGAMVIEATRQIIGEDAFAELIASLQQGHRYGNVSTEQFIELAEQASGFAGAELALLGGFYEQWLYGEAKPTILPGDF